MSIAAGRKRFHSGFVVHERSGRVAHVVQPDRHSRFSTSRYWISVLLALLAGDAPCATVEFVSSRECLRAGRRSADAGNLGPALQRKAD